ncbi:SDR family oxidoreductase [Paractinoplanes atraurantiacus]|uniref:NAD(P)H dehydrogenase (Quinone) n=1 Tax=Paractinoplanes atraurantiacus TaxID=1036182 RepID=A0A285JSR4_9ACTN|nr:SDR family oxidoreductase [Actinoplanes atraurantiacus]SNY63352.1 NAD(P)H dehydrogenase (quinone) [Actinoplanes atraurantiacus]
MTIVVTGATGHLGRLAIESLLAKGVPAGDIVGLGRQVEKIADLGITVKKVSYEDQEGLRAAFENADKVLFISASEPGKRIAQHTNVVEAAKAANVGLLVYTSAPKADTTDMKLAGEHAVTEKLIKDSGLPYVILRNGWYVENYPADQAVAQGLVGASGDGRISLAPRADYAEAAAAALVTEGHEGKTYELGGEALTKAELAAEISRQTGKPVTYTDLDVDKYTELLVGVGLPREAAEVFADVDRATAAGALFVPRDDLEKLLGRPATPVATAIKAAL